MDDDYDYGDSDLAFFGIEQVAPGQTDMFAQQADSALVFLENQIAQSGTAQQVQALEWVRTHLALFQEGLQESAYRLVALARRCVALEEQRDEALQKGRAVKAAYDELAQHYDTVLTELEAWRAWSDANPDVGGKHD